MNLRQDIREYVLANLPHNPAYTAELETKTAESLLIIYSNWRSRLVPTVPRRVHRSKALSANPLSSDARYNAGLAQIAATLESGQDLTPYLSRGIRHGYIPRRPGSRRQDLDLLLNDWGVYHLHISVHIQADGFAARTKHLLFAIIRPRDAYLIDIVGHGDWTRQSVVEIMVREWPDANLAWEMKGIVSPNRALSDIERSNLRGNHTNASFGIDGKTYMAAGGLTSAGTSFMSVLGTQHLFRTLDAFEQMLRDNPDCLREAAAKQSLILSDEPDFKFEFLSEGGFGVVDKKTGIHFQIGY
jgi:hypothetical protein